MLAALALRGAPKGERGGALNRRLADQVLKIVCTKVSAFACVEFIGFSWSGFAGGWIEAKSKDWGIPRMKDGYGKTTAIAQA